jgi:hypothetical protein
MGFLVLGAQGHGVVGIPVDGSQGQLKATFPRTVQWFCSPAHVEVVYVDCVRAQDVALSMACAINQYKGTDLLELKILLEI